MSLSRVDKQQVRELWDSGIRWQVIAELFNVSRSTIDNTVTDPPSEEEISQAEELRTAVHERQLAEMPRFGPYVGDGALFMEKIFGDSSFKEEF